MNENALRLAKYWRNSLADADQKKGSFSTADFKAFKEQQSIELDGAKLGSEYLSEELVGKLFEGESQEVATVEVTIRPWVYAAILEHGQARNNGTPAYVTPIVSHALVNRHGQIFPTANTTIPRDILEPLDVGSFSLGNVTDLDKFLTEHSSQNFEALSDGSKLDDDRYFEQWKCYLQYCAQLLECVGQGWPHSEDSYLLSNEWYVYKEQKAGGASQHIIKLYDDIRENRSTSLLFERYAEQIPCALEPCLPSSAGFSSRLGHASDIHSLAKAQRDTLTHMLVADDGDILGVNGPPGTGKTTLLLSVVASLWAKAALAGGEPPVIVASSTNNQAVTNIIDAFGKDFSTGTGVFAGRWLPSIDSFGAYLPSKGKEGEMSAVYQTSSFFAGLETPEYLEIAKAAYLAKASIAFPSESALSVQEVVDRLQQCIKDRTGDLRQIEDAWDALCGARYALHKVMGNEPNECLEEYRRVSSVYALDLSRHKAYLQGFEHYLAKESIFFALFSWLPPVANKRIRLAKMFLKLSLSSDTRVTAKLTDSELKDIDSWKTIHDMESGLVGWGASDTAFVEAQEVLIRRGEQLITDEQRCVSSWIKILAKLQIPSSAKQQNTSLNDCDILADTQIRFPIFLLATHYWEGRWLLEMDGSLQEILKSTKKSGRKTLESRWRRWMKLTPCVVSTFFMLPSQMKGSRHNGSGFVDDYLYNFIDLLIVDEAGQVLPEVAGASFALAKQSLAIGDTQQIEPIWSIPTTIDIGNLTSAGLLPRKGTEQAYEVFASTGKSVASGSVMRIAQNTCRYHYDAELDRGMFLYEHRRCYDSIIDYCNKLCYHGKLQPMRGSKSVDDFPGMGYLHVDGLCQQSNGGSRHNIHEASAIAAWLAENRVKLEAKYEKSISEIVGIITPFAAQTNAIESACGVKGIKVGKGLGEVTVGTVHSFQGAERLVIIFSAVYSKHADGGFIDQRQSMLNVAVSRAKDSFLVFGDMDVLGAVASSKPRGLLAEYLFRGPANKLHLDSPSRED